MPFFSHCLEQRHADMAQPLLHTAIAAITTLLLAIQFAFVIFDCPRLILTFQAGMTCQHDSKVDGETLPALVRRTPQLITGIEQLYGLRSCGIYISVQTHTALYKSSTFRGAAFLRKSTPNRRLHNSANFIHN